MNFHILAKKNFGPGVAYSEFTTVRASMGWQARLCDATSNTIWGGDRLSIGRSTAFVALNMTFKIISYSWSFDS